MHYKTKYNGDSGIDLVCPEELTIDKFNVGVIDFNIKCEMINIETSETVSYYLYPRSSISNTPLLMANSVGIIDEGYRGNIMAKVRNIPINDEDSYTVQSNTRLFQICAPDLGSIQLNVVQELSNTERGNNGFGSSGLTI
jgi:dUTP pyrophosphatase